MVDYSKWDRMDFSDSDDDSDVDHHAPRVTSLDSPGRVTIGTDGSLGIGQSSLPSYRSGVTGANTSVSIAEKAQTYTQSEEDMARKKQKLQRWQHQLTHNGGRHRVTVQTGEKTDVILPIFWSQDRYAITLRLGFPHVLFPSKSIRVRVMGALNYKDRFSAVGSGSMSGYKQEEQDGSTAFGAVEIASLGADKHQTLLLSGKLPRPIYLNQDEDEIGFDVEDNLAADTCTSDMQCTKFVTIVLPKAVPMEGIIIWWEHPLLNFPKIDISCIQDRNNSVDKVMSVEEYNASMDKNQSAASGGETSEKETFAKAWNEAHRMFREKVNAREKQEINIDD